MMPIEYEKNHAVFVDFVSVEEADGLLGWIQDNLNADIDLERCSHLHPSNLQVLMAAKICVKVWPTDAGLRAFLETALKSC